MLSSFPSSQDDDRQTETLRDGAWTGPTESNSLDHVKRHQFVVSALFVAVAALAASFPAAGQSPAGGKLILTGDLAVFAGGGKPENCFLRNRFKRGETSASVCRRSMVDRRD